ncbi:aminoacyl-tRNA hydrolase [Meiothermus hypogaeus]|uniref:Peptidyl-tRNA hydrolase n=2 Tax=Meiothermus hypogaeus TaxID=884155 RepID=A0A511QZA0_9DEIN|nr:aminoacyl-tRNA hydrolase [Meiothermus hypogaeus]RIH79716.1 Peptidyl-tRNA hydrolase [Meiothermus hypogaeus]GEM82699.1 peptidyl-tRNA hydrolase [Meiothermus hypogaeus NBRC 106114]GIW37383.1 MAG: peptidyl-tRNA hydrolase [Meiothermus sp.]
MFLIVGQGNPGLQYARTKHNVGFWVLDRLASDFRHKGKALIAEIEFLKASGERVSGLLVKPTTFYNATGEAVAPLAQFYKIPPERILVVHDELDLPPGRLRFKVGGSNAGNYGLESIAAHLGTRNFHRLRIGIGKPPTPEEGANWVLSGFHPAQARLMEKVIKTAAEAAQAWAIEGIEACQKKYNGLNLAVGEPTDSEQAGC